MRNIIQFSNKTIQTMLNIVIITIHVLGVGTHHCISLGFYNRFSAFQYILPHISSW